MLWLVDAEFLAIIPKFQILLDKIKKKINKKIKKKVIAFKFPSLYHLGFHDVTTLPLLLKAEPPLFETIRQRSDFMKAKIAARGKFKRNS